MRAFRRIRAIARLNRRRVLNRRRELNRRRVLNRKRVHKAWQLTAIDAIRELPLAVHISVRACAPRCYSKPHDRSHSGHVKAIRFDIGVHRPVRFALACLLQPSPANIVAYHENGDRSSDMRPMMHRPLEELR